MTHKDFNTLQEQLLCEVRQMVETKGKEYANSDTDRLANFKEVGNQLGISAQTVLLVYLHKHMRSIDSYVKNERTFSNENIRSRIVDAITYLTLLDGLIVDNLIENADKRPIEPFPHFNIYNPLTKKEEHDKN